MRLGTYSLRAGQRWRAAAFISDDRVIDLAAGAASLRQRGLIAESVGATLDEAPFNSQWLLPEGIDLVRRIVGAAESGDIAPQVILSLSDITVGPAIPYPGKFIAVGRNYMDHVREGQRIWAARGKTVELPTFPTAFAKFSSGIIGDGMPIVLPAGEDSIDYEIELAVVIGRPAFRVTVEDALQYVAGYTICNDVGARRIQMLEMEKQIGITLAKNFRSFAPVGPWMVTADEIPDPQTLEIQLSVNGEIRQHANTSDMIFSVAMLVSYWSQIGLEPGDMITTGTPSGVALAMPEPEKYYLRHGDMVEASIEGIGVLHNRVEAEQERPA